MEKYSEIVFAKQRELNLLIQDATDECVIPRKKGEMLTRKQSANISYDFTTYNDSVVLSIDGQAFDEEDIDDLILFLKASKKEIRRRVSKWL